MDVAVDRRRRTLSIRNLILATFGCAGKDDPTTFRT